MSGNDLNNSSAVQAAAKALFNRSPLNLECRQELMDRKKQFITSNKELQSHLSHLDITELTDCLVWIPESELYIGKVLGRGASGLCNEAKTNLGQVAVKAMKVQELMILAHVTYHGRPTEIPTLPVYGLSRKDGKYLMIMELGSCSLESKLSESAFENFDTVHAHATIIADRLRQVHILGIIHKDLNPKNLVLASSDSGALIVDFGLSTTIDDPRHEPGSYGRGEYLPPEALTAGPFTTAYDIHCLGSVMWHLLPSVPLSKKYLKVDREEVLVPSVSNDFTSREEELIPGVLKEYMNIYVDCWNPDPLKRPTIDNIIERLRKCKPQSESPTPWSKESLDFIERQQQDAEHERKSTGNSETTVESQFSPRMAPLSTTNNQTNTYTFQEPQQALPLTMTKGYKFQAAEPSASGINTNGVSAPEPVYVASPKSISGSFPGEGDVESTSSTSSIFSVRITGKGLQWATPRSNSPLQSTPVSNVNRSLIVNDDEIDITEKPLESDAILYPMFNNEVGPSHLWGKPLGKIKNWDSPQQPYPECQCQQYRIQLAQCQAQQEQYQAQLAQCQAQLTQCQAQQEQYQAQLAQFKVRQEQNQIQLAQMQSLAPRILKLEEQLSRIFKTRSEQKPPELGSIGQNFKQTLNDNNRVIRELAPQLEVLQLKARGPSVMLLHKAAAQAARVSGKSPAPSKGIGSDTLRTPADSPAESSAQSSTASNSSLSSTASRTRTPKNSRAVAGRKRPLSNLATNTGSSQMTTANSPTSANGLPTVTIAEIPTQPYNSRMQSPAKKAQSPARKTQSPRGIVPSSEMRTPYRTSHIQLGKSKESPAKTWK